MSGDRAEGGGLTGENTGSPAAARPASTVVALRPSDRGPEVLMVRRSRTVAFMADAYVFPGGRIDEQDGLGEEGLRRGAARELLEEVSISVSPERLEVFAHWLTPSTERRRYDTWFFLAELPAGQVARHDTIEAVEHLWEPPRVILERHDRGEVKLPPPTLRTLEDLSPHASIDAARAFLRSRPITLLQPKLLPVGDTLHILLPWDVDYAAAPGEGIPIEPGSPWGRGASRFVLDEGRWRSR